MRVLGSSASEVGQTHFPGYSPAQLQLNTLQLVQRTTGEDLSWREGGKLTGDSTLEEQLWGDPGVSLLASSFLEQALEGAVTQTCRQAMGAVAWPLPEDRWLPQHLFSVAGCLRGLELAGAFAMRALDDSPQSHQQTEVPSVTPPTQRQMKITELEDTVAIRV